GSPLFVGPLGAGSAAKLVANSTLFGVLGALGEAMVLAGRLGLSRESVFEVLAATPLAAQAERRRPQIDSGGYPVRFSLALALKRWSQAEWLPPMLATLTERRFSDPGWIFERKLDGERCLAFRRGARTRLLSRNQLSANDSYPEVVAALARQSADDFVVDGE